MQSFGASSFLQSVGLSEAPGSGVASRPATLFSPAGLKNFFLCARIRPSFAWPETFALMLFAAILAICIPHHESWFDEAQAWLIARDSSLFDLFVHRLHYEGAPGLWHLLLWLEIRLHLSFLGMRLVAGLIACGGAATWLYYSPLPRALTLLMPFTFFLQYQYAVVARSYVLAPLFTFALLALYSNRTSRPIWFALLAGLFANCSLHMAALSFGLSVLYLYDRLRGRQAHQLKRLTGPVLLLCFLFAASAATAIPTSDGSSTTANPIVSGLRTLSKLDSHTAAGASEMPKDATPASTAVPVQGPLASKIRSLIAVGPDSSPKEISRSRLLKHLIVFLTASTVPISTSNLLAIVFLVLLIWNLAWASLWRALLPLVLLQACNTLISGEAHHIGLVWLALLAALWMLASEPAPARNNVLQLRYGLYAFTLLIVVLQISWAFQAVRNDVEGPYSSSVAAAAFIGGLPIGTRLAAFDDDSVTINAYLPHSPYFNQRVDYWPFSRTRNPDLFFDEVMKQKPDMVSVKMAIPDSPTTDQWVTLLVPGTPLYSEHQVQVLKASSYHETHRFCGKRFFRNRAESADCRAFFEPSSK